MPSVRKDTATAKGGTGVTTHVASGLAAPASIVGNAVP